MAVKKTRQAISDKNSFRQNGKQKENTSVKSSKPASSMEELLAKTGYTPKGLKRGDKVSGTVVDIGGKTLILDIGAKAEGVVSEREFEAARAYIKTLKEGDSIEATVINAEGEGGYVLLSLRDTASDFIWKALEEKRAKGEELEVKVDGLTRGGLTGEVYGIPAFVPTSHLGSTLAANPQEAVGRSVKVKVIEIDREKGRLVLSEKAVSEAEFMQKQKQVLESIKPGERFTGRVTKVLNFGAFVEVVKDNVPVEGLVHLSEIAWNKVANPGDVLTEGDEVEVVSIGKEGEKLALSIRQTMPDPWSTSIDKYKKDDQVAGRVTKVGDFGAFIELEPGVEGLIRTEKIPPEQKLTEGEEVKVIIDDIDQKNHKLSLGLVLTSVPVGYR